MSCRFESQQPPPPCRLSSPQRSSGSCSSGLHDRCRGRSTRHTCSPMCATHRTRATAIHNPRAVQQRATTGKVKTKTRNYSRPCLVADSNQYSLALYRRFPTCLRTLCKRFTPTLASEKSKVQVKSSKFRRVKLQHIPCVEAEEICVLQDSIILRRSGRCCCHSAKQQERCHLYE